MGSIIDRALDIINDHLKDQTSSFADPVSTKAMARGGEVMARGGTPRRPIAPMPMPEAPLDTPPPQMGHNMPPEPTEITPPAPVEPTEPTLPRLGAKMPMEGLHPQLISQRLPTAVKAQEKPNDDALIVGLDAAKAHPKSFEHNVNLVKTYDHLRPEEMQGSHDEVAENFINHLKDNYLFLHDAMPEEQRERARHWYVGANKFSERLADRHDADRGASAAAIAAMSPQKDWFQNASLAERLFDIHHNHGHENYSRDMEMTANRIFGKEKFDELLDEVRGKKYNEIQDPRLKAIWARLYDETYHDPAHRIMTPEGVIGDWVTNQDGSKARVSWGSTAEILKGIKALMQGATRENISELMGERHKIRNFYNNILDPHSPSQDVTVDTHAVAGGLLEPLGANATQVSHNFKNSVQDGSPAAKGSAETGVQGTYPLYAEALRRAAAERGIEPREMQSITWEGLKGLFPDTFKTEKNIAAVRGIWQNYAAGNIDIDDARKQIVKLAGGMNAPAWTGSPSIPDEGTPRSTYQRKLPKADVHGGPAAVVGGTGGADSSGVPRLEEQELRSYQRNRELTRASRQAFGQEALPQSFRRRTGRTGQNNLATDFDAPVRAVYDATPEAQEAFSSAGISAPSMVELASGAKGANAFHAAISKSKETNPLAASVHAYDPKEYAGMRLFMTPNGKAGFALKGDDIVSVFNSRDSGHTHVSNAMLQLAIAQGGRRLDAFDTALPHIYSRNKFRVAARMPWNEEYKPEGWNHKDFAAYNGGKPDVVFMHYDPAYDALYDGAQGVSTDDYDQAVKTQSAGVKKAENVIAKMSKKKTAKAYGGAISPVELHGDLEDEARRLILWSYAAAPVVRPLSRADGGSVDYSLDLARKRASGGQAPDDAQNAVGIARNLTPMGFYSAAAEAARKIPQRAPLEQILNKVKGSTGVKEEEIAQSGVRDAFAGQKSVDPKDVAAHLEQNLPKIQEQTYGGAPIVHRAEPVEPEHIFGNDVPGWVTGTYMVGPRFKPREQYVIHEAGRTRHPDDKPEYYLHGPKGDNLGDYQSLDAAEQAANDAMAGRDPVRFGDYTLPGGNQYREVVMSLPPAGPGLNRGYESKHWPQPNVLAHLRMSDRSGSVPQEQIDDILRRTAEAHGLNPDNHRFLGSGATTRAVYFNKITPEEAGTLARHKGWRDSEHYNHPGINNDKILHLEELQSDWGQDGRDDGFSKKATKNLSGEVVPEEGPANLWRVNWEDGSFSGGYGSESAARARLNLGKTDEKGGIPTGPYVTDTDSWTDLALKRALKEAAEGDYNKLVWTPGQAHADRYGLEKKISALHYSPDTKHLMVLDRMGTRIMDREIAPKELQKMIGKELAGKLLLTEPVTIGNTSVHSLMGDDLAFGGHGMTEYYDRMVPGRLKKIIQRLDPDAKIELFAHDLPGHDGKSYKGHVLHLTPKLKEAIKKGLPAYKSGGSIVDAAFKVISKYS